MAGMRRSRQRSMDGRMARHRRRHRSTAQQHCRRRPASAAACGAGGGGCCSWCRCSWVWWCCEAQRLKRPAWTGQRARTPWWEPVWVEGVLQVVPTMSPYGAAGYQMEALQLSQLE
jgi:hypothetical protein